MKRKLPPLTAVVAFEAAARHASFKKAGEELCVTSSAISHQVRALEGWFGVQLFERSARTVELTDFGLRYSRELGTLLNRLEKISDPDPGRGAGRDNPIVTIQTTDSFAARWLLPRLPEFEVLHPHVTIRIITRDFRAGLRSSEADLGILFVDADQVAAATGENTVTLLFAEAIFPVCSPQLVRGLKSIRIADLQKFTLIHDDNLGVSWDDWFAAAGAEDCAAQQPKDGARYNHSHLALAAAELGNGFALASSILSGDALKAERLVAPFKEKMVTEGGYALAYTEKARQREDCRAFGEWLTGKSR